MNLVISKIYCIFVPKLNVMEEIYKDIEGYEGLYQVSNLGNVKSLVNNKGVAREKVLKPFINSDGYKRVILCKNNTIKGLKIHRLVAKSFIENPNNYPCVNHKDECKTNNVVSNLEWCTHKYNINWGTRNARAGKAISKAMKNNPNVSKQVGAYKDGELIFTFPSTNEAERQGYNHGNVCSCCNGKLPHYKGYIWKYI